LNPRKTRTRDTGLTGSAAVAGDCHCRITGCSSCAPSVSNHILASDDHENDYDSTKTNSKTARGRSNGDNDSGIPGAPLHFYIMLFTDYIKPTEVREVARRVITPSLLHNSLPCTTERQQPQPQAPARNKGGVRRYHLLAPFFSFQHSEEVYMYTSSFFLFSTQ